MKPLLNEEELADTEKVTALWSSGSALGAILGGVGLCVGGYRGCVCFVVMTFWMLRSIQHYKEVSSFINDRIHSCHYLLLLLFPFPLPLSFSISLSLSFMSSLSPLCLLSLLYVLLSLCQAVDKFLKKDGRKIQLILRLR